MSRYASGVEGRGGAGAVWGGAGSRQTGWVEAGSGTAVRPGVGVGAKESEAEKTAGGGTAAASWSQVRERPRAGGRRLGTAGRSPSFPGGGAASRLLRAGVEVKVKPLAALSTAASRLALPSRPAPAGGAAPGGRP